jgi:hypothetical protein
MIRPVLLVTLCLLFAGTSLPASQSAGTPPQTTPAAKPDDLSGKWHFVNQTEGGERETSATFSLTGAQVTGKYSGADVKGTFKDGDLDLAFPFNSEEANMTATLKLKGKLKDGKLVGNWQYADYEGSFVATKVE